MKKNFSDFEEPDLSWYDNWGPESASRFWSVYWERCGTCKPELNPKTCMPNCKPYHPRECAPYMYGEYPG